MRRRRYLSVVGVAVLGSAAGCSTVRTDLQNRRAASGFDFPPGLSVGGVEDPTRLVAGHLEQLQSMTFTAEFVDRSENYFVDGKEGRIRSAGTPEFDRWEIDHRVSPHATLYRGSSVDYSEKKPERETELIVGNDSTGVSQAVIDSVGTRYREALEVPYGSGTLDVRSEGETDVAVFTVNSPNSNRVDSVETMELAGDENGVIRRLDAVYTGIRQNPAESTYDREYHYRLDVGSEPPEALSGIPDRARTFPTFGVEWRDGGRVMELTNTGGGDVLGRGSSRFMVSNLTVSDMAWGDAISFEPPFSPGETRYLFDRDGLVLADAPPNDATTVLRTDQHPFFLYENSSNDGNGPIRLEYATGCDGLNCS